MIKSFFYIRKKIFLNLVKLGCYLNIPFLSALGIYLSLYKSKKIKFEKNSKKTAIVFYKSGGIQDLESAFVNSKSKNKIFYLHRELFRELNYFFIRNYSQSIVEYKNSKKNSQYQIFLENFINWLNKFLNEIYKLGPLNEDLLKFSSQEIFLLNQIQNKKNIDTQELFDDNKKFFSRAQFYRYLAKLKKENLISIKNTKIEIAN